MAALLSRKVWDAVSGDEVLTLAHKHIVKSVSFTQVGAVDGDFDLQTEGLNLDQHKWHFEGKKHIK